MASSSLFASIGSAFSLPSPTPPPLRSPQLAAFDSALASQLQLLRPDHTQHAIASTAWLSRALQVLLSTHASMEAFLPDLLAALAGGDTKWLHAYLDDSAKLLDICNALKDALADISSYRASLDVALRCLQKGSLGESQLRRARNALGKCTNALARASRLRSAAAGGGPHRSRLDKCCSVLRRMGEKLSTHHASKSSFFVASFATQLTTVFLCGVLTSVLSLKSHRPLSTVSASSHQQGSWSSSLNALQHSVKEHLDKKKIKGVAAPLQELEKTQSLACKLYDCIDWVLLQKTDAAHHGDELRRHARSLQVSVQDLSQGLSSLEFHVNELFRVLIASRLALLEVDSQSRSTQSR